MHRLPVVIVLMLALSAGLAGCGQLHSQFGTPSLVRADLHYAPQTQPSGFPAFTPFSGLSATRRGSDSTIIAAGDVFAEESTGSANYADSSDPGSYVLVPAKGGAEDAAFEERHAWARYRFADLTGDRPVRLNIAAAAAPAQAGGSPDLPLSYYVGLSNYTQYQWEWFGPFTSPTDIILNAPVDGGAPAVCDRYVSQAGELHCIVLADATGTPASAPDNPRGLVAVKLRTITVTTAPGYVTNKPHYVLLDGVTVGTGHSGSQVRRVSALMPEQYVHVEWTHVAAFGPGDAASEAKSYLIYRQSKDDGSIVQVGEQPGAGFIDPTDALAAAPEPQAGLSYRYIVLARNDSGDTPVNISEYVLIPLFTPQDLTASLNGGEDGVRLNWQPVSEAVYYEVWRGVTNDSQYAGLLDTVDVPATTYLDTTAVPANTYYYWVRAVGESGVASPFSTSAVGLRMVLMTITCLTSGVSGNGTSLDPFRLDPANTYLMGAHDQIGTDITFWVVWSVVPDTAASFSTGLDKNRLISIQPDAGLFQVEAVLKTVPFEWTGMAYCQVP